MVDLIVLCIENLLVGMVVTWVFEFTLQKNKKLRDRYYRRHEVLFGYHVHHSTMGLLMIVAGGILFLTDRSWLALGMAGFGIGIIIQHTLSSRRFVFFERETFSEKTRKKVIHR